MTLASFYIFILLCQPSLTSQLKHLWYAGLNSQLLEYDMVETEWRTLPTVGK